MLKEDSRSDTILRAAKRAFLRHGYDSVSMDAIAEEAATTKRTLYNHFGSKEQLFEAVVRFVARINAANLVESFAAELVPSEAVVQFCLRYAYWSGFPDAIALQRIVIALAPRLPQYAKLLHSETYAPAEANLAAFVAAHFPASMWAAWDTPAAFAQALMNAVTPRRFAALLGTAAPYPAPADLKGDAPHTVLFDEEQIRQTVSLFLREDAAP